jgi:hypothetical protein
LTGFLSFELNVPLLVPPPTGTLWERKVTLWKKALYIKRGIILGSKAGERENETNEQSRT